MKRKSLALIGAVLVCITTLTGCTKQSPYFHTKNEIKKHLKQKYGKNFVIKDYSRNWFSSAGMNIGWDEGGDTYAAYPEDNPELRFTGYAGSNGTITDEYVIRSVCNTIKEKIEDNIKYIGTDYVVAVYPGSPYYVSPDITDTTLSTYLENEDTEFDIYIFFDDILSETVGNNALTGISGLNGWISIYQTDKMDYVKNYTKKTDKLYSDFFEELKTDPITQTGIYNSNYCLPL